MEHQFGMEILQWLFGAFVLGVIAGSLPGQLMAAIFAEILNSGLLRSLRVVVWAMVSEIAIAVSILLVFFSLEVPKLFFHGISIVGAGVLIGLGIRVWKTRKIKGNNENIFSFGAVFALMVFNGPLWIFWLTICLPQAFALHERIRGGQFLFLVGFETGWFLATLFWAFLFSRFRPLLSKPEFVPVVFKIFSLILFFFAVRMALASLGFFLE